MHQGKYKQNKLAGGGLKEMQDFDNSSLGEKRVQMVQEYKYMGFHLDNNWTGTETLRLSAVRARVCSFSAAAPVVESVVVSSNCWGSSLSVVANNRRWARSWGWNWTLCV